MSIKSIWVHKRVFLLGLFCFLIIGLKAQDETMGILDNEVGEYKNDTLWVPGNEPALIVVPFEPMMYKSQIDRSIGTNDGTTYNQIVSNFRRGLDNVLFIENDAKYSVVRMIVEEEDHKKDLHAFYNASSRDYRVVPKKESEEESKKLKFPKLKKKEKVKEQPANGTSIQNGQIVSHNDGQKRFMARVIKDSSVFDYMYGKYGSVLYLFINEFDIGPMDGLDYRAFESDEYQRQITVHYSVYTHKQEIYSGIAVTYFSSTVNSQKDIIIENFPALAKEIGKHIPHIVSGDVSDIPKSE